MRLPEKLLEIIYENGYDNWENLLQLNEEVLGKLGID
jgi:hypothetical protein